MILLKYLVICPGWNPYTYISLSLYSTYLLLLGNTTTTQTLEWLTQSCQTIVCLRIIHNNTHIIEIWCVYVWCRIFGNFQLSARLLYFCCCCYWCWCCCIHPALMHLFSQHFRCRTKIPPKIILIHTSNTLFHIYEMCSVLVHCWFFIKRHSFVANKVKTFSKPTKRTTKNNEKTIFSCINLFIYHLLHCFKL